MTFAVVDEAEPAVPYVNRPGREQKLDRPKRRCSNCGRKFQQTTKRYLLCADCFSKSDSPYGI